MTPKLRNYSVEFQNRAADELETTLKQPPCQRQQTEGDLSGCSAVRVIVKDHLELRDKIRALNDELGDRDRSQTTE